MKAGSLRHRLRIDSQVQTQDPGTGEQIKSWAQFAADVPAAIVPLSGKEFLSASAEQASVDSRITIRQMTGIVPTMRLVDTNDGSRIYSIVAVLPDPTLRRHLTLMCVSGVLNG